MKTAYFTLNQNAQDGSQDLYNRILEKNKHLPDAVLHEKSFQIFYQVGLLGTEVGESHMFDCYGFFENCQHDVKMAPDALVGSIQIRVDYDPNFNYASDHEPEDLINTERLIYALTLALSQPNTLPAFPDNCGIDHIRVTIRVAPDKDVTRTYWPQQLAEYVDRTKLFY